MLTLTFLGQASIAIKCERTGVEIVSDPWFSGPAHLDSWHPYPHWTPAEVEKIRDRINQATHIYLSHDHADHFDPEFLRSLSRKTILVGNFQNQRFRSELDQLSALHEIRYVRNGESVGLNDTVSVQLFLQQPDFRTDSIMLCVTPDATILNANDCGLDTALLRAISDRTPVTLFLYTLNFMANGYPISYLASTDPTFQARMTTIRNQVVDGFRIAMDALNPRLSGVFAGPVTFGDSRNDHLNSYPESLDWTRMVSEVRQSGEVVWPAPFSTIEFTDGQVTNSNIREWRDFATHPHAAPVPTEIPSREDLFKAAQQFVETLGSVLEQSGQESNTRLVLAAVRDLESIESDSPEWVLELDFRNRAVRWRDHAEAPYVQLTLMPAYILEFLTHKINVDDVLLSARGRFKRDPDTFDSVLHNLLRYGGDPLAQKALVRWVKKRASCSESIAITVGQTTRRIPKYCPHEGESLEGAPVIDGKLVCPRHRWAFDLSSGQCTAGDRSVNLYTLVDQPPVEVSLKPELQQTLD